MSNTKQIGGRTVRWNDERADEAYARGWWVRGTLADSLADAAQHTPQRTRARRRRPATLDCQSLHDAGDGTGADDAERGCRPAAWCRSCCPIGMRRSVVYLAATIAGMVVNPILPSLRDRELLFILDDANTRMIFVPSVFGRHDYASMLTRVVAELDSPPEVVVVRGDEPRGPHTLRVAAATATSRRPSCRPWIRMRSG